MHKSLGLLLYGVSDPRVAVSQDVNRDTSQKIEVCVSGGVENIAPPTLLEREGFPGIVPDKDPASAFHPILRT